MCYLNNLSNEEVMNEAYNLNKELENLIAWVNKHTIYRYCRHCRKPVKLNYDLLEHEFICNECSNYID